MRSQRGEALPENAGVQIERCIGATETDAHGVPAGTPHWYVLWTRSNCEQLVHDQLSAKGFMLFLPKIGRWSRRGKLKYLARVPMFPSYVFLRHAMDKLSYIEVSKTKGLARILGDRWDRLGMVPDHEIKAIQKVFAADLPTTLHPYLREGQRVRVTHGPLANAEGILVKSEPKKGLLVLSVELLRRSVAVEVDCTWVIPA